MGVCVYGCVGMGGSMGVWVSRCMNAWGYRCMCVGGYTCVRGVLGVWMCGGTGACVCEWVVVGVYGCQLG